MIDGQVQTIGGVLFAFLLMLIAFFVALRAGFFRLPPKSTVNSVTLSQTIGIFLSYFIFSFILFPLLVSLAAFIITGSFGIPASWLSWAQICLLFMLFIVLCLYCLMIDRKSAKQVFWGEEEVSQKRFFKTFFFGLFAFVVSYPFVLFISSVLSIISYLIWKETGEEQVAVSQLKKTMENPALFASMIFSVVVIVPFMEELLFRGFLQNYLKRVFGRSLSIFFTAAIFSLFHFSKSQGVGNFQLILSLLVLALFIGLIYEKTRAIWAPFALHMIFNASSVLFIFINMHYEAVIKL